MQLPLRVGAGGVFEEEKELPMAMSRFAQPGDPAGGDVQGGDSPEDSVQRGTPPGWRCRVGCSRGCAARASRSASTASARSGPGPESATSSSTHSTISLSVDASTGRRCRAPSSGSVENFEQKSSRGSKVPSFPMQGILTGTALFAAHLCGAKDVTLPTLSTCSVVPATVTAANPVPFSLNK